jgi:hypothetical protein
VATVTERCFAGMGTKAIESEGLAERGGFEPPVEFSPYDGLANRCFRPLSHLSAASVGRFRC